MKSGSNHLRFRRETKQDQTVTLLTFSIDARVIDLDRALEHLINQVNIMPMPDGNLLFLGVRNFGNPQFQFHGHDVRM